MPHAKNRWTVKTLMIVIALTAVILYAGMLFVRSYIYMVRAGW
jgi:Zn-dependent protease with chaperone function